MTINDDDYREKINEGRSLVLFWAEWCHFCHPMKEHIEQHESDTAVYTCDIDSNGAQFAHRVNILTLPTMIEFLDGKEITRRNGAMPKEELLEWIG